MFFFFLKLFFLMLNLGLYYGTQVLFIVSRLRFRGVSVKVNELWLNRARHIQAPVKFTILIMNKQPRCSKIVMTYDLG